MITFQQSFHGRVLSVAQVRTTLGCRKALHQHEHRRLGRGHRVDRLPTGRVEAARCTQGASCHPGASFRAKYPVLCTPSDGPSCEPLTSVGFPGLPSRSTRKGKIFERCAIIGAIIRYPKYFLMFERSRESDNVCFCFLNGRVSLYLP